MYTYIYIYTQVKHTVAIYKEEVRKRRKKKYYERVKATTYKA